MSTNDYAQYLQENRRLVMLRILSEMPSNTANSSMLDDLLEKFAHHVSRDVVKNDMHWLAEQGLIALERAGDVLVGTLTQRGLDVSRGEAVVEGVAKPSTVIQ
ncbi:MAG: ArsR family transcriptional regulator [Azoarcus sp.]|jgi:hypothetical protein|nr:ArsR family transcriptional regulator [Azoarcus sp.]